MQTVTCPECDFSFSEDHDKDATYTTACPNCLEAFSYRVVNGEVEPWSPPKIAGIRVCHSRKPQTGDVVTYPGKITKTAPDGTQTTTLFDA